MANQEATTVSETVARRTTADWDNYFREKLIEIRKLVDMAKNLEPEMTGK